MPYIPKAAQLRVNETRRARTAGELNFQITDAAHQYVEDHGLSYATLNTVVGALECAKAEFLRRVMAIYEDAKIEENGDMLPFGT